MARVSSLLHASRCIGVSSALTARTSKWFGTAGDGVRVWSENGHAFAGFHGAKGADGINGLQVRALTLFTII